MMLLTTPSLKITISPIVGMLKPYLVPCVDFRIWLHFIVDFQSKLVQKYQRVNIYQLALHDLSHYLCVPSQNQTDRFFRIKEKWKIITFVIPFCVVVHTKKTKNLSPYLPLWTWLGIKPKIVMKLVFYAYSMRAIINRH